MKYLYFFSLDSETKLNWVDYYVHKEMVRRDKNASKYIWVFVQKNCTPWRVLLIFFSGYSQDVESFYYFDTNNQLRPELSIFSFPIPNPPTGPLNCSIFTIFGSFSPMWLRLWILDPGYSWHGTIFHEANLCLKVEPTYDAMYSMA